MNPASHWDYVYKTKAANVVSWYRPHLDRSLALIEAASQTHSAAIVDVGGGESTLVDDLLAGGYHNLTVFDASQTALALTKQRLGRAGDRVLWICGDVTQAPFAEHLFDVWHDRAVFHFLTTREERIAYVEAVKKSVKHGGYVIVSTFGPEGPTKCSGLPVMRYDTEGLHGEFGNQFQLIKSSDELHKTPVGTIQQFLYCYCRMA